jgi:hypothetical protein
MSFFPDERTTARVVAVLVVGVYGVMGTMAALWWLDEEMHWAVAAFMYAILWAFTFSDITRVGPQVFFRETRFIALKVAFLLLVGVVFALGFFVAG